MSKGPTRESSLSRDVYYADNYFSHTQLWSYLEQVRHIWSFKPKRTLEVGVGSGLVSAILRNAGMAVATFDINPSLRPDFLGSVQEIEATIPRGDYDLIACCEVLEHLPSGALGPAVESFARLSNNLFLTLPVRTRYFGFGGVIRLPFKVWWCSLWLPLPWPKRPLPEMHSWELGSDETTGMAAVLELLRLNYLDVETDLFRGNPHHRYFRCQNSRRISDEDLDGVSQPVRSDGGSQRESGNK